MKAANRPSSPEYDAIYQRAAGGYPPSGPSATNEREWLDLLVSNGEVLGGISRTQRQAKAAYLREQNTRSIAG